MSGYVVQDALKQATTSGEVRTIVNEVLSMSGYSELSDMCMREAAFECYSDDSTRSLGDFLTAAGVRWEALTRIEGRKVALTKAIELNERRKSKLAQDDEFGGSEEDGLLEREILNQMKLGFGFDATLTETWHRRTHKATDEEICDYDIKICQEQLERLASGLAIWE